MKKLLGAALALALAVAPVLAAGSVAGTTSTNATITEVGEIVASNQAAIAAVEGKLTAAALETELKDAKVAEATIETVKTGKAIIAVDIVAATGDTITLENAAIKAGNTYVVLHFPAAGGVEVITPTVTEGKLTFATPTTLSPFVVVEGATGGTTAPTTGDASHIALYAGVAAVAGLALVATKKKED